jgi:hypothetical protein
MKFQVNARIEKVLWSNETAWLYKIVDVDSKKQKGWTVFTQEPLNIGSDYQLNGYITETKDKKRKDENAKDIWQTTFNVEFAKELDGAVSDVGDIPF